MKSMKIAGFCLVAVFVVSMVAAGGASAALPEIRQCRNVGLGNGHWKDSQCSKAETGGEWATKAGGSLKDETFSSVSGEGKLETANGTIVTCTADKDSGEITGPKTVAKVVVIFTGCTTKVLLSTFNCESAGANVGEIRTNLLKGEIGYLNKAEKKVGLLLEPEEAGGLFAEFNCAKELVKVQVKGAVIAEFTKPKTGEMSTTAELHYALEPKGKQHWKKFEGGGERKLETSKNGGAFEESAIETQDTITFQFDTAIIG